MARKRTIEEFLEIKSRERYRTRTSIYYSRFPALLRSFEHGGESPELLRYFPIGAVAAMEAYFRAAYAELIDAGEPYASRIEHLVRDIRIDWRWTRAIEGKHATSGDLIAHSLSVSSLGEIQKTMNALLATDFLQAVKSTPRDPSGPTEGLNIILHDADRCFASVAKTFDLRHIFCHESATSVPVNALEMQTLVERCRDFVFATDQMLSQLMDDGRGLSNAERTIREERKSEELLAKLADAETRIRDRLPDDAMRTAFVETQDRWRDFLDASARYAASGYGGGTGYGLAYYSARSWTIRRRIEELENEYRELEAWVDLV